MNKYTFSLCTIALITVTGTANAQSIFQNHQATPTYQNVPTFQPVNYSPPQQFNAQFGCVNGQCSQGQGIAAGGCNTEAYGVPHQGPAVPTQTNYGPVGQREILPAYTFDGTNSINSNVPGNNLGGNFRGRGNGNFQRDPNATVPCMHPGCPGHSGAELDEFRNRMRSQFQNNVNPNTNAYPPNFQSNYPTFQPNGNLNLTIQQPSPFTAQPLNTPQRPTQIGSPFFN